MPTASGRQADDTRKILLNGASRTKSGPTINVFKDFDASKRVESKHPPQGTYSETPSKDPPHLTYGAKIHHRVIYAEVGVTIAEVGSLYLAFQYLSEAAFGTHLSLVRPSLLTSVL